MVRELGEGGFAARAYVCPDVVLGVSVCDSGRLSPRTSVWMCVWCVDAIAFACGHLWLRA